MGIIDVARTLAQVPTLLKLKKGMQPRALEECDCIGAQVERNAARIPERPALLFEGRTWTWREFNALANRYAASFRDLGLARGDAASVFMENRVEFLATIVALNKLGVTAGLINTNLRGRPLIHCITVTESRTCIVGAELTEALGEVRHDLPLPDAGGFVWIPDGGTGEPERWLQNIERIAPANDPGNPPEAAATTLGENAFYVFTSGTTGLPKAAVLSNRRFLASAALAHRAGLKLTEADRVYVCLPLYHATGLMIGVGSAISAGASVYLRRRFSASNFLREVRDHGATCFIYIGELCRYLLNTPASPDDHRNPLTRAMGNGLRPDIWMEFKSRFGIGRIAEFYGASEGNVAFANLLNKDCTVGMTSVKHALVRYDVDADAILRDARGRCIAVEPGEPGLLLGHIGPDTVFEGYTNRDATEKKIVRDAFEDGDAWFNSGDLLRQIDAGFTLGFPHYQFVDRVGDTFRWKGENVSTNEVGEIINRFPAVRFSNVYGVAVPGTDGRAGMAALTLEEGVQTLDLDAFAGFVGRELPVYARPVFLRIEQEIDVTGTFKMVKGQLRDEGYDPARVSDPLFVMKPGSTRYEPLDAAYAATIAKGEAGY
jgi:citronellyl-CoA synthetase